MNYLRRVFRILDRPQKRKLLLLAFSQIILSSLDLLGIIFFAGMATIAIAGIEESSKSTIVSMIEGVISIQNLSLQFQVSLLGGIALSCVLMKSIISITLVKHTLTFLGKIGSRLSTQIVSKLLSQPLRILQNRSSQETLFSATRGVDYLVIFSIGSVVLLIVDTAVLLTIFAFFLFLQIELASITLVYFALVAIVIHKFVNSKVTNLGRKAAIQNVISNERITETFTIYREILVRDSRKYFLDEIAKSRNALAELTVSFSIKPYLSKYILEGSMILISVLICVMEFSRYPAPQAITNISLFFAAASRITPSLLRAQQSLLTLRSSIGQGLGTLSLIESMDETRSVIGNVKSLETDHIGFSPDIRISGLSFKYDLNSKFNLRNFDLQINPGEFVAIVGESGSGKSTVVDLILGINLPQVGEVLISGLTPNQTISKWPGAIGYVPQDVPLISGTVKENICLGFTVDEVPDSMVWEALELAALYDFVNELPLKLNTYIGGEGLRVSGGQKQRFGIARAMLTRPNLIIFDEATSSLDEKTESSISEGIFRIRKSRTVILVTHDMNSIRGADSIVYLRNGQIEKQGSISEVKNEVPDFDYYGNLEP